MEKYGLPVIADRPASFKTFINPN